MSKGRKCSFTQPDGTACQAYALKEKQFCFSHDPESREAKALAVRRGGAAKASSDLPLVPIKVFEPRDIVALLAATVSELREGTINASRANSIGILANQLLKAFEATETQKKLHELQALLNRRNQS